MLKDLIIEYLKDNRLYHGSTDPLIDELMFNIDLLRQTKEDIIENGYQKNITRNPDKEDFFQTNRSVDNYNKALKNVRDLYKDLILSPSERQKMKLAVEEADDLFDLKFKK